MDRYAAPSNFLINEGQSVDPGGTFASHTFNDPRVLIAPMVAFSTSQGRAQVLVKGFAALWPVSVDNKANINTYFINQVAPGSTPLQSRCQLRRIQGSARSVDLRLLS